MAAPQPRLQPSSHVLRVKFLVLNPGALLGRLGGLGGVDVSQTLTPGLVYPFVLKKTALRLLCAGTDGTGWAKNTVCICMNIRTKKVISKSEECLEES